MKKITLKIFVALTVLMLLWACGNSPKNPVAEASLPPIYPDYADVTVPVGIAPLNFEVTGADRVDVTVTGEDGGQLHVNGRLADFPVDKWRKLLEANKGKSLTVTVNARSDGKWHAYKDFKINVSPYELDAWGLTYRRIAPGYEKWGRMGLYQRQLSDFTESPILENSSFENGCLNCHSSWRTNPDRFVFHIRGTHGATLVQTEKGREWLNTKTDQTLGTCVYPYWHPSGRFVAFSTNTTRQVFHAINSERIEVFDYESDLQIYDVETHELLLSPLVKTPDWMESYPVFSPDGKTIYFCTSRQYDNIKESIDVFQQFGNINLSEKEKAFFRVYMKYDDSNKNKALRWISMGLNSLAFAVLFIGLVVPISLPEKAGATVTIFSAALLFFSLWLLEKQKRCKEQWEELRMLALATQNTTHKETENAETVQDQ